MTQYTLNPAHVSERLQGSVRVTKTHLFTVAASGQSRTFGRVTWRKPGPIVAWTKQGQVRTFGKARGGSSTPFGSFRDFAHYGTAMVDPGKVLVGSLASGTTLDSGQPSGMRRIWCDVTPPREFLDGSGNRVWPRAAFMGLGVRVNGMAANSAQYIDGAQVEVVPKARTGPSAYAPARSLNVVVRPDRLNYCPNPKLDVDASGYSGSGVTRVAQGSGWAAQVDGSVAASLGSAPAAGKPGQIWTVRATVMGPKGRTATLRIHDGDTFLNGSVTWTFTGTPQEVTVPATNTGTGSAPRLNVYPSGTWAGGDLLTLTNVLLERASSFNAQPGAYFDGGSGIDYLWDASASVGTGPSYYYRDRVTRSYLLNRLLQENCPLGVIPPVPQFAVLPSE